MIPQDLMIDNWVMYGYLRTQVKAIHKDGNLTLGDNTTTIHTDCKSEDPDLRGVLLTPEMLTKCKEFEVLPYLIAGSYAFDLKKWMLTFRLYAKKGEATRLHVSTDSSAYLEIREIRYLHQLQNFFFSITGQPLTINF